MTKSLTIFISLFPQDGRTALISASRNGHSNVVEMLLAAGAKPDYQKNVRNLASMSLKLSERVKCLTYKVNSALFTNHYPVLRMFLIVLVIFTITAYFGAATCKQVLHHGT